MDDQLIGFNVLFFTSILDQPFGQGTEFTLGDHPADHITAKDVHDHIQVIIGPFNRSLELGVSSPEESHLQALSEPGVNLSAHRAPIVPVDGTKPARQCGNKNL